MTKATVAIIGSGGIGRRHLQSCCDLSAGTCRLIVVDASAQARREAALAIKDKTSAPDVEWLSDISGLPAQLDVVVIATQAHGRAGLVRELLDKAKVRFLVLEKFLFQSHAEYEDIAQRLQRTATAAWVNCPTRLWPGYLAVRQWLHGKNAAAIEMTGANWDIGCNAIHYADLFAFLTRATELVVDGVEIESVAPAKRQGMLHIEGTVEGLVDAVPFRIVSSPRCQQERVVEITTPEGKLRSVEGIESMSVTYPDGGEVTYPIPFQSRLTSGVVSDVLATGQCGLPVYAESRKYHEALLAGFLRSLNARGALNDPAVCPVT